MTKQTQIAPDAPTVDFLRRRFKMADEYIASIRRDNENAGVPSKYLDSLIQWRGHESIEKKRVEDFIAKATDKKKPGHWWQFSDLKNRGLVSEDEESEYEHKRYPIRQVNSISKIKTPDGRFFLRRFETWYALNANGAEIHRSFDFLDYYARPGVGEDDIQRIPIDPADPNGPTARVKIVRHPDNHENNLVKEWITPWSKEKFDEVLSYSVVNDNSSSLGPSFLLEHPRFTHPVAATYEQMIAPDSQFDRIFEEIRAPKGDFNDFLKQAKKATEDNDDNHSQYG